MRNKGNVEARVDLGEELVARQAAVASERPAEAGLPGVRGNLTTNPRGENE